MTDANYAVLRVFRSLFEGRPYFHRDSSLGDRVASYIYEDLYQLSKSAELRTRIDSRSRVLNAQNLTVGVQRRRGDGTFGERVPVAQAIKDDGFAVARGPVATIEIGVETKILAKAMIKQIDRVIAGIGHDKPDRNSREKAAIQFALGLWALIWRSNIHLTRESEPTQRTGKNISIQCRKPKMQCRASVSVPPPALTSS